MNSLRLTNQSSENPCAANRATQCGHSDHIMYQQKEINQGIQPQTLQKLSLMKDMVLDIWGTFLSLQKLVTNHTLQSG